MPINDDMLFVAMLDVEPSILPSSFINILCQLGDGKARCYDGYMRCYCAVLLCLSHFHHIFVFNVGGTICIAHAVLITGPEPSG